MPSSISSSKASSISSKSISSKISSKISSRPTSKSQQNRTFDTTNTTITSTSTLTPSELGTDQVVIQSKDGFFYEGLRKPKFANNNSEVFIPITGETVITKKCLLIHGAIARPKLNINDTVLIRKSVGIKDRPDLFHGKVQKGAKVFLYLPGVVLDSTKGLVTVYVLEKELVIAKRKFVIRVGYTQYSNAVKGVMSFSGKGKAGGTNGEPTRKTKSKANRRRDRVLAEHQEELENQLKIQSDLVTQQADHQSTITQQNENLEQNHSKIATLEDTIKRYEDQLRQATDQVNSNNTDLVETQTNLVEEIEKLKLAHQDDLVKKKEKQEDLEKSLKNQESVIQSHENNTQNLEGMLEENKKIGERKREELSLKIEDLAKNLEKGFEEKMSVKIELMQAEQEQIVESYSAFQNLGPAMNFL